MTDSQVSSHRLSFFKLKLNNKLKFLGLLASSIFAATPAFADHSDDPVGVALVGSLQSELNCPGDWQPECSATELTQDGDLWQGSFLLPAGNWEYKVALNDGWDESYGDNGNNVVLFLEAETLVTFTYDHSTHSLSDDAPIVIVQPASVAVVGDLQTAMSCPGDWQPECVSSELVFDETDLIWQQSFELPAGDFQYKAALADSWDENYGANAEPNGPNIPLVLSNPTTVKFYYDHQTHWLADNQNNVIATIPGNFQTQLGCSGDWQPDCLRSWLKDEDGDGVYQFVTTQLLAGNYEGKVTINESWDENYGQNGEQNGSNISFNVAVDNDTVVFTYLPETHVLTITGTAFSANLREAQAYWLAEDTLAWNVQDAASVELKYSSDASLQVTADGLVGGESIALSQDGVVDGSIAEKFRHLSGLPTYKVAATDLGKVKQALKSQMAVYAVNAEGAPVAATGVQPPGVLDQLYTYEGALGPVFNEAIPTLSVWAPTAQNVQLHLFDSSDMNETSEVVAMTEDTETGVWSVEGDVDWHGKYYQFEVQVYARSTGKIESNLVTDPYSLSLSVNSKRSQIVDLNRKEFKPRWWDKTRKPKLKAPEDQVIYELHVRDFSIHDGSVPESLKGTFKAFALPFSKGKKHLRRLSMAGLTSVHLLPAFDCATINENKSEQATLPDLSGLAPDSEEQQAAVEAIRGQDGFNWCYDPYHYTVPEGSYSTNPDSTARIVEFRQMVQSLNRNGLRVIMDVVYNHTSGSLQGEKSVLDKIVPDYYHRLNANGDIEMSSCCANTATEHNMMEKLMLDSLKTWATAYKVDGFRFDLMGHHTKANILKAKEMLQSLTKAEHGVDGRSIYLYGEGWNFGEVVNDVRFEQARQWNMGNNTGVGSFNDRIRDAVRGGGPFDSGNGHVETQGFINGLYYDPNEQSHADLDNLLWTMDRVRLSLSGTLKDYMFEDRNGNETAGVDLGGFASDPQESINYIAAHDNETLFDVSQYKLPLGTVAKDRMRVQNLGNSILLLSQGVPFIHAGQEILRSKSMDRNSYDAGDWFNFLDYSYKDNGWGRGLPLASDNENNWFVMQPRLANADLAVSSTEIKGALAHMREMLFIRKISPLFRLETAAEINSQVQFHNTGTDQVPGLIVMSISSDSGVKKHFALFNASTEEQTFSIEAIAGDKYKLHPVLRYSRDAVVRKSGYDKDSGTFTVPARTTAVFNKR